jgi:hypothetical protein
MDRLKPLIFGAALLCLTFDFAWSQEGETLFQQGQTRLSVEGGYGSFDNNNYLILGAGVGYYVWNGLEAGLDSDAWIGSKPHVYEVSPRLTYVFYQFERWKPYIGGFYRRTFYDTLSDLNSAGARAGLITALGPRSYLSAGLVYENYFNCNTAVYSSCSEVYPELGIGFNF